MAVFHTEYDRRAVLRLAGAGGTAVGAAALLAACTGSTENPEGANGGRWRRRRPGGHEDREGVADGLAERPGEPARLSIAAGSARWAFSRDHVAEPRRHAWGKKKPARAGDYRTGEAPRT